MIPAPRLTLYFPTTRRAWIEAPAVSGWMSVDDVYEQAFAWFDLARELRGRNLAVEAVEATEQTAEAAYPNHHPATALANHRAGHEVWDTNGDLW